MTSRPARALHDPYLPRGDQELRRFAEDITASLNRPFLDEFTVSVPLEDALLVGRPQYGLIPVDSYLGSTTSMVAGWADCTALTGASIGTNSIKAVPFIVDHAFTLTALAVECTTLNATSKARAAVYDSVEDLRGNFYPNQRLVTSDEFDCGSTGVKRTSNLTVVLEPGHVYWAAFLSYTAAATVNTIPVAGVSTLAGCVDSAATTHISVAYTLGATAGMPILFPSGGAVQTTAPPAVIISFTQNSAHEAVLPRIASSPNLSGCVLRRVRIVKANALTRTPSTPSVLVRAVLATDGGQVEVGRYDSEQAGLRSYTPRVISGQADINKSVDGGTVLAAEITQRAWSKLSMRDAAVLFDLAHS